VGRYIVTHNGTLEFKDKRNEDKYRGKNIIDSQAFAMELALNKNPFPKALQETIGLFDGKFAIMVYDRESKTQFIARGRTAPLHKSEVKIGGTVIGYVINTAKLDLEHALHLFKNQYELQGGDKVEWSVPEELEAESIFVATSKFIKKIGEVKETSRVTYTTADDDTGWGILNGRRYYNLTEYEKMVEATITLAYKNSLSLKDLDEMCLRIYGEPMLGMVEEEIVQFCTLVLPEVCNKNFEKLSKKWRNIRELFPDISEYDIALKYHLQYPYYFNNVKKLRSTYNAATVDKRHMDDAAKKVKTGA
jgi:hypothetical protein